MPQMCIVNNLSDDGEMLPQIFFHPLCRIHAPQSSETYSGAPSSM